DHPCLTDNGGCDHVCLIGEGHSKVCRCAAGFTLQRDGKTCSAQTSSHFLFYGKGQPGTIKGISFTPDDNSELMIPVENLGNPRGIDFYAEEQYIYYSDSTRFTIGRQKKDSLERDVIIETAINNCEGIAVDWMGKNIYWTDDGLKSISVAKLDGSNRKTLITGDIGHPRAIVVDPADGYLYWANWAENVDDEYPAKIERAQMDGGDRLTFVSSATNILWPNGLSIDKRGMRLYWCDAFFDSIESIGLNRTDRRTIVTKQSIGGVGVLDHPFGLVFSDGNLYWTEYRVGKIYRYNLRNRDLTLMRTDNAPLFEIRVYDQALQEGTNECSANNGGCEALCLAVPLGKTCGCPDGQVLTQDQRTCSDDPDDAGSPTCDANEFECNNGRCILMDWKCDGDNDCTDNSDEEPEMCSAVTCRVDQFKCATGNKCIPQRWLCDGDSDCTDDSDEESCDARTCLDTQFQCATGQCIPLNWKCDRDDDCGDYSDEPDNCSYPTCELNQFACSNGRCIPENWKCDSDNDCADNSDELRCPTHTCNEDTEFRCRSNPRCINKNWVCDGDPDCEDGSDEENCPTRPSSGCHASEFQCRNGNCIPKRWLCDSRNDCLDGEPGSDEENCPDTPATCDPITQYTCDNNQCIAKRWRCDEDEDCDDGSDEVDCVDTAVTCRADQFKCATGNKCIPQRWLCDGDSDCTDDSDEESCD
ncbi:low-density lipoprotein receptor-related protein 1-like, partial [Saccoglossus kowalevskii]